MQIEIGKTENFTPFRLIGTKKFLTGYSIDYEPKCEREAEEVLMELEDRVHTW